MKRFKVVHLTTVHPPLDIRIFRKECRTLVQAGYDVTLIANANKTEVVEGIKICGLGVTKSRWDRMTRGLMKSWAMALMEKGDVYHFHDPELIPVGLLLKLVGKKVIYDVHEDFAASLLESDREWMPSYLKGVMSRLVRIAERIGVRAYDAVVAATPKISALFPGNGTVLVQNYPIIDELICHGEIPYSQRPGNIIYAGGISERRGIGEMIRAMNLVSSPDARLILAGNFDTPRLAQQVLNIPGWDLTTYLGLLQRSDLAEVMAKCRMGLVLFYPIKNHIEAQPNKLFEYMSAGIPVIVSNFPMWREIVEVSDCGILVDPLSPEKIAEAIKWLLENPDEAEAMGKRGKQAVEGKYNWDIEKKKLLTCYEKILAKIKDVRLRLCI